MSRVCHSTDRSLTGEREIDKEIGVTSSSHLGWKYSLLDTQLQPFS
jgi:hypothetical protein